MTLVSRTYWTGMPFWFRRAPDGATSESLVLRAHDMRQLRALYWTRTAAPKIGVVIMHPRVDFHHHYAIPRLLEAGCAVLAANPRHGANELFGDHEEMVLDLGACVRHLIEQRGIERVVLLGNCGGGSLAAYYQAQAVLPAAQRDAIGPSGAPTFFDGATLPAAHAVVLVAPHRGQGKILMAAIDPSVTDERDPLSCDPALDMYDARNGFREPPAGSTYDAAFLERYREAQRARVARIDTVARVAIAAKQDADPRRRVCEPIIVVYRTMANPAFVDREIDPSPRDYGSLLSEQPHLMNYAALGLARTSTPRAWLSTWSALSSRADLVANVARFTQPTLLVQAARDREIFPADLAAIGAAIAAPDKRVVTIDGARHYFEGDPGHVEALMDVVIPWIEERCA